MFNGYNEAPLIYNDFEHERGRKQQNVGKWPYGHGTGIQSHPPNQAEFWTPKSGPFLKFPNVLTVPPKCTCSGCYPSGENPSGIQGDAAARHRPWFHRPVTVPLNGSDDPSKLVGAHHWENLPQENLSQEKSCSVGASQYLQENGEKSSLHRPYQPGVITSAKSAEISRKEEASKRPEEIITSPGGHEILLLDYHAKKEFNAESAAVGQGSQTGRSHRSAAEPYGKPVPFNPTQNRVPSTGNPESYLDPGKSIRTNHQAQSFPDPKGSESKMELPQNGYAKHVSSVYGSYLDYPNYGLKRDFPIACNPVGNPESQKFQYYNNKKPEYLARNYFPEAMRKTGSSLYEESKRDCMVNANAVIHEQYLGALGRSNVPKYWENPKVSSCGVYYPKDPGGGGGGGGGIPAEKRSRPVDSFDFSQRSDPGLKRDLSNRLPPPHPSIYSSDPTNDVRYDNHPFHYQNNSAAYKNLRKADYSTYARYNHQPHYPNAYQIPELGNQFNYQSSSAGYAGIEQYLPHLTGGGGGGSGGGGTVYDSSCQQIGSVKHYPQSFYDPTNFQPVSTRSEVQAQQIYADGPGPDRTGQGPRTEDAGRTAPNKISPLRLLRKKKLVDVRNEQEKPGIAEATGVRNQISDEGAPALDVRRFWATWAEEEDDNSPQTQMVVLDCRDIDPEQAELLRLYDADASRTVHLEGTDVLTVKNSVEEQKLELGGSVIELKTDCNGGGGGGGGGSDDKASAVENETDLRAVSDYTVDKFIKKTEEKPQGNLVKNDTKIHEDEARTIATEEPSGASESDSKPPKKSFKKSAAASEEIMDKWTEKKFDFLKRAEESKAAEQEKKKILDCKKLYKFGNKVASVSKNLASDLETVPLSENDEKTEGQTEGSSCSSSSSTIVNLIDRDKSEPPEPPKPPELPTSEYRKNKFLDYSESEDVLRRRQENSEPALENDKAEEKPPTETAEIPLETEPTSVPLEELDEILEKISRISFDGPDSSSDKSRDSVKSEKSKKLKKTGKKFKKPNHQDPKIKFSIQKFQDLKISFKIHNEPAENTGTTDNPISKINKPRRAKKSKIKTPIVKIKEIPTNPSDEKTKTEKEEENFPMILDLSKHRAPAEDFRVQESLDSTQIKLTIKRRKTESPESSKEERSSDLDPAIPAEKKDPPAFSTEDATTVAEESLPISVDTEARNVSDSKDETSAEEKVEPESLPVIIENEPHGEKRKTVIRHSLDENPTAKNLKFEQEKDNYRAEDSLAEKREPDTENETRSEKAEKENAGSAPARRDSIETRLSEMFGHDSGNDDSVDRSKSLERKDVVPMPPRGSASDDDDDAAGETEPPGSTPRISEENEKAREKEIFYPEKEKDDRVAEIDKELRDSNDEDFESILRICEPDEDVDSKDRTAQENEDVDDAEFERSLDVEPEKTVDFSLARTELLESEPTRETNVFSSSPDRSLPAAEPIDSAEENSEKATVELRKRKILFRPKDDAPETGRSRSLSPVRFVFLRSEKSKSLPPSIKFYGRENPETDEEKFTDVPVSDIPLPDGEPPEENVFDFRELAGKNLVDEKETELKLEISTKAMDDDDSLRFPLPSPTLSEESSRSESCRSPFVLSGFDKYRNPSPPCEKENSGQEKTEAPRVDSVEKSEILRNPSPPSSKFTPDSPLSTSFKSDSEDFPIFPRDSGVSGEKPEASSADFAGKFRDDRIRTPSPLRPENRIVYGTDCPLSKESIEEGTRISDAAPSESSEIPREEEPFRAIPVDSEDAQEEELASIDLEDAIFVSDEIYECEGNAIVSEPLPAVDGLEEEKVSDDKFHDVMESCLENAKKFLGEDRSERTSCSAEEFAETVDLDDRVSLDVFLTAGEEPTIGGSERSAEENFPSSELSTDLPIPFETEAPHDLCPPEFLPVDNWPYLEEEVPMSPGAKSKTDGSEISSPPLENCPSSENTVCLYDPLKNLPDSQNVIPAYLNDEKAVFGNGLLGFPDARPEEEPSETVPALNGLRRRSLVADSGTFSASSSLRRRKTIDGIAGNYVTRRKPSDKKTSDDSSKTKKDLKCRLSLERLSLKKNDGTKIKGNVNYLSREWQPKVLLSRISDRELKEKRRTKCVEVEIAKEPVDVSRDLVKVDETRISDDVKNNNSAFKPESNKTSKDAFPLLGNGLVPNRIDPEEKARKKPRFRNLHSKKNRIGRNESPTDSETDSDEPGSRKITKRKEISKADVSKNKDDSPGKLGQKKVKVSLDSLERKEDKKSKNRADSSIRAAAESCKRSKISVSAVPGSENDSKRKKPSSDFETDSRQEGKKKRKPEQAPQVSSTSWICEVCGFSDRAQRSLHIKTHAFHCQSCHLAFKTECRFTEHLTQKHKDIKNQHHCLLCELSFDREEDHRKHLESREHKHLESVEKNTINTLFTLLTGQPCPVFGPVELKPEWLPTQAGTVHFYHQATPLSLALQYLKMRHESCSSQPK